MVSSTPPSSLGVTSPRLCSARSKNWQDDAPVVPGDVTGSPGFARGVAQVATYADDRTGPCSRRRTTPDPYRESRPPGTFVTRRPGVADRAVDERSEPERFVVRYVAGYGARPAMTSRRSSAAVPGSDPAAVAMTAAPYENREGQGQAVMEFGATGGEPCADRRASAWARLALAPYVVHDLRDLDARRPRPRTRHDLVPCRGR